MFLVRPPGVYAPQGDTRLLLDALTRAPVPPGARVLDLCSGTGALAVAAARLGASRVWAVDISALAALATWCNARMRGLPVTVRRGDLLQPVAGGGFDVVVANPPYVPCPSHRSPRAGRGRAWDAGPDGRAVLDRLCEAAPDLLAPNGVLLVVHSALCGPGTTVLRLGDRGLKASVVARRRQPFGAVLHSRAAWLEASGLIGPGERSEELVVVRADRVRQPG